MASLAGRFDPRFIVISARSPIELGPFAFGWFSIARTPGSPPVDPMEVRAARSRALTFIDEVVATYQADPGRVFLAGFSQGGIVALGLLLAAPDTVAGAVSMSGWLPPELVPDVVPIERLRDKPVLIVHGAADDTIGVAAGRDAADTMRRLTAAVQYQEFEMGHTTTDLSMAAVAAWLTAQLDA